jgi:hypothetical protein
MLGIAAWTRVAGVLAVALTLAGCGGSDAPSPESASGEVVELTQLAALKAAYAEGEGKPRLLLLLSPT